MTNLIGIKVVAKDNMNGLQAGKEYTIVVYQSLVMVKDEHGNLYGNGFNDGRPTLDINRFEPVKVTQVDNYTLEIRHRGTRWAILETYTENQSNYSAKDHAIRDMGTYVKVASVLGRRASYRVCDNKGEVIARCEFFVQ